MQISDLISTVSLVFLHDAVRIVHSGRNQDVGATLNQLNLHRTAKKQHLRQAILEVVVMWMDYRTGTTGLNLKCPGFDSCNSQSITVRSWRKTLSALPRDYNGIDLVCGIDPQKNVTRFIL